MEDYHYIVKVNGKEYCEVFSHQELFEQIEQIRVERGEGATYKIELHKV